MRMAALGAGVVGLALLLTTVWSWRGKTYLSRWWTRAHKGSDFALVGFPSVGLAAVGVALINLNNPPLLASGVFFIAGGFVLLWGTIVYWTSDFWWPIHRAWGPRWYVRQTTREKVDASLGNRSLYFRADNRKPPWANEFVSMWYGNQIANPYIPSSRDVVTGRLWVYEGGLWFDATDHHKAVQESAGVWARWTDIIKVSLVRGSENADGSSVPGLWHRSWWHRVAVTTTNGTYLYELESFRASKCATAISEQLEASRAEQQGGAISS